MSIFATGKFCKYLLLLSTRSCPHDLLPIQTTTRPTLPASDSQQQEEESCIDTPGYLDIYNGGCVLYELSENEAWCEAYGNNGEVGMTPNENCCVCKGKSS